MAISSSAAYYVLAEAAKSELSSVESVREDAIESKFETVYAEMDELSEDLMYAEDAIPIFGVNDDLYLLSLYPQKLAIIHGGIES